MDTWIDEAIISDRQGHRLSAGIGQQPRQKAGGRSAEVHVTMFIHGTRLRVDVDHMSTRTGSELDEPCRRPDDTTGSDDDQNFRLPTQSVGLHQSGLGQRFAEPDDRRAQVISTSGTRLQRNVGLQQAGVHRLMMATATVASIMVDPSVQVDDPILGDPGTLEEVVDVLRDTADAGAGQCFMGGVGACLEQLPPPPLVPTGDEFGVFLEPAGRGQFHRVKPGPQAVTGPVTKGRDAALGAQSRS